MDDKIEQDDRIVLKFDSDILGDFGSQEANGDDYELVIDVDGTEMAEQQEIYFPATLVSHSWFA